MAFVEEDENIKEEIVEEKKPEPVPAPATMRDFSKNPYKKWIKFFVLPNIN